MQNHIVRLMLSWAAFALVTPNALGADLDQPAFVARYGKPVVEVKVIYEAGKVLSLGTTGLVYSHDGYVLFPFEPVRNASTFKIVLDDLREFEVSTLGFDEEANLAIAKIAASALPLAKIGDPGTLNSGAQLFVIASSASLGSQLSPMTFRALVPDRSKPQVKFIRSTLTDASKNWTGPLFNSRGELVGFNLWMRNPRPGESELTIFAMPATDLLGIAERLKQNAISK